MNKLILITSFLFLSLFANAQFDTNFVHVTKDKFTVYPMGESAYLELNFSDPNIRKGIFKSTLTSRYAVSAGFGMSFYRFGFSLSFQIPYSDIKGLEDSKAFSFAGGYSYHRFYGELRYRDFRGFQKSDILNDSVSGIINIRKDIELRQIGLALDYFFSKKYNFDAAYKNYNSQKKSAATFLLMMGVNKYDISGKYLIIDTTNSISNINLVRDLDVWSIKFAPGGAATIVYRNFYISSLVAMGLSYNANTIYGDLNDKKVNSFAPVVEMRAVAGYNSQKWFSSLSLNVENDYFFYERVHLSVANVFLNFKIGYKFNSKYLGKIGKYL